VLTAKEEEEINKIIHHTRVELRFLSYLGETRAPSAPPIAAELAL
jgi:hypothetical protein